MNPPSSTRSKTHISSRRTEFILYKQQRVGALFTDTIFFHQFHHKPGMLFKKREVLLKRDSGRDFGEVCVVIMPAKRKRKGNDISDQASCGWVRVNLCISDDSDMDKG